MIGKYISGGQNLLYAGISRKLQDIKNYFSQPSEEDVKFDFDEAVNLMKSEQ